MFLDIQTSHGGVKADLLLQPFMNEKDAAQITPDVCGAVLEASNDPKHIKSMLQCIARLEPHKIKDFKEVVLAAFFNREQPNDILVLAKKLAVSGKFERAFNQAILPRDGDYLMSDAEVIKKTAVTKATYIEKDLPLGDKLLFTAKYVQLREVPNLQGELDFSHCAHVALQDSDLKEVRKIVLAPKGAANFMGCRHLPKDLDVSECADLVMEGCRLKEMENLRFADGASVDLLMADGLPRDLDVSRCAKIDLSYCDLADFDNLKFRSDAMVYMQHVKYMPEKINFSGVAMADLSGSDFKRVRDISWADDMVLFLDEVKNLPEQLDFSKCSSVSLRNADMSGVAEVVFKNKEQMRKSHWKPHQNWRGVVRFEQEDEPAQQTFFQKVKNMFGR